MYAQYPFLSSSPDLTTAAAQAAVSALIDSVDANLFNRAADAAGKAYWSAQLTAGAVPPRASILTIANGAVGADATVLQIKIAAALDFTQRSQAAGLAVSSGYASLSPGFTQAAKAVLAGVDGNALSDASVAAGLPATTTYLKLNTINAADYPGTIATVDAPTAV